MIAVSGTTAALLDEGTRYIAQPIVIVLPHLILGGGAEDVSHRVQSLWANYSMDNPVAQASVTLSLGTGSDSFSPFLQASAHRTGGVHLLTPGAEILIGFYVTASQATAGETIFVFQGRVDRITVNAQTGTAVLLCRDLGAWWMNTVIRTTVMLGSDAGTEASEVMTQIMAAADSDSQIGLAAPSILADAPPDYMVYTQPFGPESALEAMRRLAQQAGRDVRWFMNRGIRYYEPDRLVSVPDLIIGGRRYESITDLSWGDEDVRNIWDIYWQAADSSFNGPVNLFDQTSINLYGPRYARVYLQRAENIRDTIGATIFGISALADSKDPFASHAISMPLEPRIELNDFHRYLANGREYDTDLEFAVAAYRHEWKAGESGSPGVTRTTVGARGKPIAAYRDYRRSLPPAVLVSTQPVPPDLWAPEGTLHLQVDDLTPP